MALTAKQRAFVENYSGNATEAAIKAGYSNKSAGSIGEENLKFNRQYNNERLNA